MKQLVTMSQLTPHRYLGGFIPGMVAVGVPQLVLPPGISGLCSSTMLVVHHQAQEWPR